VPAQRPSQSRKDDHLDLCAGADVSFAATTTLLEEVSLVHDALPDLALGDVDLGTALLGKRLRAPLLVAAMTGGVERAERLNRDLASVAEEAGIGLALGSQRPLLERGRREGYFLRDAAPTALLLGNLGVVQARDTPTAEVAALLRDTGVDALCLHLNPAMEAVQPEGDRDFRRGLETVRRLVAELPVPVVVKETGCGLSRSVGERLFAAGVRVVDVGGAGGTSWVGVETLRAKGRGRADAETLGRAFWDWGVPTAASVAQCSGLGLAAIATGGVASGLDAARALALGAAAAGIARPVLQAWTRGGRAAVAAFVARTVEEMRLAHLLTGSRGPDDLASKPLVLGPRLRAWVPAASPLARRLASA
jgi:isopentenyl-diphosphate delta-isomerase